MFLRRRQVRRCLAPGIRLIRNHPEGRDWLAHPCSGLEAGRTRTGPWVGCAMAAGHAIAAGCAAGRLTQANLAIRISALTLNASTKAYQYPISPSCIVDDRT